MTLQEFVKENLAKGLGACMGEEQVRYWLRAFVKIVRERAAEEMGEQVGLLTCARENIDKEFLNGFCAGVSFNEVMRDFGLDEPEP